MYFQFSFEFNETVYHFVLNNYDIFSYHYNYDILRRKISDEQHGLQASWAAFKIVHPAIKSVAANISRRYLHVGLLNGQLG